MAERATGGRRRRSQKANGAGHNSNPSSGVVSDELYQRWMRKIADAQTAVERAAKPLKSRKGELGAICKAAKSDGVDVDAIREAFTLDKLDHLEVATKYANTGRVLRLMKSRSRSRTCSSSIVAPGAGVASRTGPMPRNEVGVWVTGARSGMRRRSGGTP